MRSSFARLTIERLRYPMRDDQGVQVADWTATPVASPIPGCWYEPTTTSVIRDGRVADRSGYTVDAPAGTVIDLRRDHIRIAGVEYELDGAPMQVPSPTGMLASTRFVCLFWEG